MFTYYENTLCIYKTSLFLDLKVMTETNCNTLLDRKQMLKPRKGGAYHKALVAFESIPERFKNKIIELVGDPYKTVKFLEVPY